VVEIRREQPPLGGSTRASGDSDEVDGVEVDDAVTDDVVDDGTDGGGAGRGR